MKYYYKTNIYLYCNFKVKNQDHLIQTMNIYFKNYNIGLSGRSVPYLDIYQVVISIIIIIVKY